MKGGHKRDNGSVLIIAGSSRMPGAAALAALGALRSGAGLVSVAGVADVCRAISTNMPEVVLLPLSEEGGVLGPSAAQELLSFDPKFDAAVIGPGLTQGEAVQGFLKELWKDWRVPTVVDADALNAVAKGVRLPRGEVVLTPHVGELSRLLRVQRRRDRVRPVWHTRSGAGQVRQLRSGEGRAHARRLSGLSRFRQHHRQPWDGEWRHG